MQRSTNWSDLSEGHHKKTSLLKLQDKGIPVILRIDMDTWLLSLTPCMKLLVAVSYQITFKSALSVDGLGHNVPREESLSFPLRLSQKLCVSHQSAHCSCGTKAIIDEVSETCSIMWVSASHIEHVTRKSHAHRLNATGSFCWNTNYPFCIKIVACLSKWPL